MWKDAAGTRHARAPENARIVSLVPSLTELLAVLGLADRVVGRTRFCIHPRDVVAGIADVGGTKDVMLDRVRQLAPTHLVVNVDENQRPVVDALRADVAHVIVTHPRRPRDNVDLYQLLGGIFARAEAARVLAAEFEQELATCRARSWPPERVLYLIWKEPWMTVAADTYIARTLAVVGWKVLHGPGGLAGAERYPVLEDLDTAVRRVDRVLLCSEPYRFRERHVDELRKRFPDTPITLIDGEMTGWYGARAIAGLRYLRAFRVEGPPGEKRARAAPAPDR